MSDSTSDNSFLKCVCLSFTHTTLVDRKEKFTTPSLSVPITLHPSLHPLLHPPLLPPLLQYPFIPPFILSSLKSLLHESLLESLQQLPLLTFLSHSFIPSSLHPFFLSICCVTPIHSSLGSVHSFFFLFLIPLFVLPLPLEENLNEREEMYLEKKRTWRRDIRHHVIPASSSSSSSPYTSSHSFRRQKRRCISS